MLVVKQRSALSGFSYEVFDGQGKLVGDVTWPTMAQAKNARLKWHGDDVAKGEIKLQYLGDHARVGFEYTRRGFTNDIRFTLEGTTVQVCVADLIFPDGMEAHEIYVRQPFEGRLFRANTWSRTRYRLFDGNVQVGVIEERKILTIKRELWVDLPARFDGLTQLFFFFLVHNSAFR